MNRRLVGNEANLVGYWPMADGIAEPIIDKSSYQANGKVNNGSSDNWILPETSNPSVIPISKDPLIVSMLVMA